MYPVTSRQIVFACAIVAAVATSGSLYLSEVVGLYPCELCWFQRIGMYPLVVILGVAAYEDRIAIWRTALPFSVGGGIVAAYHSYIQRSTTTCLVDGPCGTIQYELGGVLSIPNLALIAFGLISVGLVFAVRQQH